MKSVMVNKIKKKVMEMLAAEGKEIKDLIIYIDHNQPEDALTLADRIISHLQKMGEVEVGINKKHTEDNILREIDFTQELLEHVKSALKHQRPSELDKLEAELLKELNKIRLVIKK